MKKRLIIGLLVLLLLFFLLIVLPVIVPSYRDASIVRTQIDLKNIQLVLDKYKNKYNSYPTTEEGLGRLVSLGLLPRFPTDPWKGIYQYKLIDVESYQLYSFGKNTIDENGGGDDIKIEDD